MDDHSSSSDAKTLKQRLLTQAEPSQAAGIADAVVIKDAELYFLSRPDGSVPLEEGHGLGLYFRDCRFLSGYEIRISDVRPEPLAANGEDGFRSIFQLTSPKIETADGGLSRHRIGIRWRHVLDAQNHALHDELAIASYDTEPHALSLDVALDADFRDVFVIRGLIDRRPGTLHPCSWEGSELVFSYEGGDGYVRQLRVRLSEEPAWSRDNHLGFHLRLQPHEIRRFTISLSVVESEAPARSPGVHAARDDLAEAERVFERSIPEWMEGFTEVRSDDLWVERAVDRSLRDLRALRMTLAEHRFFAAGVPWFTTLFGRDSITCALQILAYRPEIAAETLRLLARFQGKQVDALKDEEPGKILHELRTGELARMGAIPYTPYYGTVDATPLFVILLGEYTRWTGDLILFQELGDAVELALRWIAEHGDHDGDGYVDYCAEGGASLINQGWKDSGNAIIDSEGRVGEGPIALVEVQGYVFLAKQLAARLFERAGDAKRAEALRREADDLRNRFNRDFWLEEKGFYSLALQRGGRPADVISSNPGQALWSGILAEERLQRVVDRLMADDMYSGWGIRTLSSKERAYNPIGYHRGTVWPHDNALIAAGLRRHGFDAEACRIFSDLLHAATYFEHYRLPEVFAGYARDEYGVPVRYPVACHPQAWAAGSIPFLLQILLGLEPDAFQERLQVVRPCLPRFIGRVQLRRLRVGRAEVDLLFERAPGGELSVHVERLQGRLDVNVVPGSGDGCDRSPRNFSGR